MSPNMELFHGPHASFTLHDTCSVSVFSQVVHAMQIKDLCFQVRIWTVGKLHSPNPRESDSKLKMCCIIWVTRKTILLLQAAALSIESLKVCQWPHRQSHYVTTNGRSYSTFIYGPFNYSRGLNGGHSGSAMRLVEADGVCRREGRLLPSSIKSLGLRVYT